MPDLDGLKGVASVDGPVEQDLEATHFDTAGLALATVGMILRRRSGGDDAGWHLRIPAPGEGYDEFHAPLGRATKTPPKPLREAVQLRARGRSLVAVAWLRTRRTAHLLRDVQGRALARVYDDTVTAQTPEPADGGSMTSWREWEIELVEGKEELLLAAGTLLRRAGATPAAGRSKLERVLSSRIPECGPGGRDLMPGDDAAAALVGTRLREQVAELVYRDPLVRLDVPDSLHKLRVATRRLRSALATFRPMLDRQKSEPLREELRWIAHVLGEARDAEVLQQRLAAVIADEPVELVIGPVAQRIDGELGAVHRAALTRSLEAMRSDRYFDLIDSLDTLAAEPPWTPLASHPVHSVLPGRVAREYRRLRRCVVAAAEPSHETVRDLRLHEVRKAAKRARYAAETLQPVYGREAVRFVKATKRLQSILGEHHDAAVTRPRLRQIGVQAALDGENAFTYGLLHGREQARAATLESQYEQAWHKASRKKRRRWLA